MRLRASFCISTDCIKSLSVKSKDNHKSRKIFSEPDKYQLLNDTGDTFCISRIWKLSYAVWLYLTITFDAKMILTPLCILNLQLMTFFSNPTVVLQSHTAIPFLFLQWIFSWKTTVFFYRWICLKFIPDNKNLCNDKCFGDKKNGSILNIHLSNQTVWLMPP